MKPLMFFLLVVMMSTLSLGVYFSLKFQLGKLSKQEAVDLKGVKDDLNQIRDDNTGLVHDILSLKTDYAEVVRFRDALSSYTGARKDVGAFREFDDAAGKLFMGLITKEGDLDKRLEKIEKKCRQ